MVAVILLFLEMTMAGCKLTTDDVMAANYAKKKSPVVGYRGGIFEE